MLVVVTGGTGFVGRRVVSMLGELDVETVCVGRTASETPGSHQADVSHPEQLLPPGRSAQDGFTLVHLAWNVGQRFSFSAQAEEVRKMAALLEYWEKRGLTRLVAAGSAAEFGGRTGEIAASDLPVGQLLPYGWAKRSAGELAKAWSEKTGIACCWLRPFLIYGPGQTGDMVIPYALRCARSNETAKFSPCTQARDFVYVDDIARAFVAAVLQPTTGFQSLNLGTGMPIPLHQTIEYIQERIDPRPAFQIGAIPARDGEPPVQYAETRQAFEVLGWRAQVHWQEGLERTLKG